eukprot:SRR837773.15202.p1 GENE.SRR837773.15202~~SRR837773.15202.p1  ORF type:complete len:146 (-),score=40.74 SRR837773.15202:63-437(-)
MKASDQGIRAYTDIVPLFMRFFPASRQEQDRLPERRARLQKKLNLAVKKFGPLLGDLYGNKSVDWAKELGWFTHAVANEAIDRKSSGSQGGAGEQLPELPRTTEVAAEGLARRAAAGAEKDGAD